ncbi:54S ribosomal protein L8, mitochondrial [Tieghemiomyces parasiticus]|uniref:54S ribosomal protein L8, mitochondrial n=1 Tax=Tieghemiomyces parasiticus TaxID=78921 RepID=A0A9W8DJP8_9FUNG|nr:54S ribosomal protein L8, mitochondrial [Tieghemiomyces parasiticus]
MTLRKPISSYGKTWSYTKAMFRNMTTSLIKYGRIETTVPKAKLLRKVAERMITFGRRGNRGDEIQVIKFMQERQLTLPKIFNELGPRFKERQGGYTRLIRIGWRKPDHAPMAAVEFVGGEHDLRLLTTVKDLARTQYETSGNQSSNLANFSRAWHIILGVDPAFPSSTAPAPTSSIVHAILACPDQLVIPEKPLTKREFVSLKKCEKAIFHIKKDLNKVLRNQNMTPEDLQARIDTEVTELKEVPANPYTQYNVNQGLQPKWKDLTPPRYASTDPHRNHKLPQRR